MTPLLFAETNAATLAMLAMLVLIVAWMLFRWQRYYARVRRQATPLPEGPERCAKERGHHLEAPDELVRWEVEMHDLARALSGKLDSKMGVLEQLILEANRAAERLEAALKAADQPGQREASARAETAGPVGQPTGTQPPADAHAETLGPAGAGDGETSLGEGPEANPEESIGARPRHQEIYTLADYGYDVAEIARRAGTPVGEVELILGLRKQR
jgi:hypothetical protein